MNKPTEEELQQLISELRMWAPSDEFQWITMDSDGTITGFNEERPYTSPNEHNPECGNWEPFCSSDYEVLGEAYETDIPEHLRKFWRDAIIQIY